MDEILDAEAEAKTQGKTASKLSSERIGKLVSLVEEQDVYIDLVRREPGLFG